MDKEPVVPNVPSAPVGKMFVILIIAMLLLIFFMKQCDILA